MKVRMKSSVSGTRNGETWPAVGEEIVLPDAEAVELLGAGIVEAVESKTEKADAPKGETAIKPKK